MPDGFWLNDKFIPKAKSKTELNLGEWFFDKSSGTAFAKLEEKIDPNQLKLEFRLESLAIIDTPFWKIRGITAQFYNYAGFNIWKTDHVEIRDCEAHFNGGRCIDVVEVANVKLLGNLRPPSSFVGLFSFAHFGGLRKS